MLFRKVFFFVCVFYFILNPVFGASYEDLDNEMLGYFWEKIDELYHNGQSEKIQTIEKKLNILVAELPSSNRVSRYILAFLNILQSKKSLSFPQIFERNSYPINNEYGYIDTVYDVHSANSDSWLVQSWLNLQFTVQLRDKNRNPLLDLNTNTPDAHWDSYRLLWQYWSIDPNELEMDWRNRIYPVHYNNENWIVTFDTKESFISNWKRGSRIITLFLLCSECEWTEVSWTDRKWDFKLVDVKILQLNQRN